ncbi:hypothetical protein PMAYCL1PPCAC_00961, partial [Pristionchus mayeri]
QPTAAPSKLTKEGWEMFAKLDKLTHGFNKQLSAWSKKMLPTIRKELEDAGLVPKPKPTSAPKAKSTAAPKPKKQ